MQHCKITQIYCRSIAALCVVAPLVSCTLGRMAPTDTTPPAISSTSPSESAAGAVSNAQESLAKRDAHAATRSDPVSRPGFSFTRVTGGCVLDNITGLMWEVKTADGGLRDGGNIFTNFDSTTELQKLDRTKYAMTYIAPTQAEIDAPTNSAGYRNRVNAQGLCGYSDWRIPGVDELQTIMDFNASYKTRFVDANWFPNTRYSNTWSSSPVVGVSRSVWYVMFNEAGVYVDGRWGHASVQLVRTHQ